jgi:anti-sigma factor RsiW
MKEKNGWQKLNAYVDGELDAREAADVANAAAYDTETADQISLLYSLKGGIHEAFPPAPADLMSVLPSPRSRRLPTAVIAILAAAIAACILLVAGPADAPSPRPQDDLFAAARVLHDQWLVQEAADRVDTPPVVLAALTRFGRLPVVPDLDSTGLSIGLFSVSDLSGARLLQIGYRGQHGCHLSLFVFPAEKLPVVAFRVSDRLERVHAWRIEDLGYLLFARGMDENRFSLIAEKVEHSTRVKAPLDERARQQLAENKRKSARCEA